MIITDSAMLSTLLNYNDFQLWLEDENYEFEDSLFEMWGYIKIDVLSEVGSALWGKNTNYKIKSIIDDQILSTLEHLENK